MPQIFQRKGRERGQGLVEYALILVLVSVVSIVVLVLFGQTISDTFTCIVHELGAEVGMGDSVYRYHVVNTSSGAEQAERLQCGSTINTTELGTREISLRGYAPNTVTTMDFIVDIPNADADLQRPAPDTNPPWGIFGHSGGSYHSVGPLAAGRHHVTAITDTGAESYFVFYVD